MPLVYIKKTVAEKEVKSILVGISFEYVDLSPFLGSKIGFSAIIFDDEYNRSIITDRLTDEDIPVFLALPSETERVYKRITSDKKENVYYWDRIDEMAENFIEQLMYECFDNKAHSQNALSEEDRRYVAKAVLETAIEKFEILNKEFPFMDVPF